MTTEPAESGRATLRDIAQVQRETRQDLNDVRKELNDRIDAVHEDLGDRLDQVVDTMGELRDGLLPRVSVLEEDNKRNKVDIADHAARIGILETAHQRAIGHLTTYKVVGGIFGGAATIVIGDVIFKVLGG